jgi:hypothetical protein
VELNKYPNRMKKLEGVVWSWWSGAIILEVECFQIGPKSISNRLAIILLNLKIKMLVEKLNSFLLRG